MSGHAHPALSAGVQGAVFHVALTAAGLAALAAFARQVEAHRHTD